MHIETNRRLKTDQEACPIIPPVDADPFEVSNGTIRTRRIPTSLPISQISIILISMLLFDYLSIDEALARSERISVRTRMEIHALGLLDTTNASQELQKARPSMCLFGSQIDFLSQILSQFVHREW